MKWSLEVRRSSSKGKAQQGMHGQVRGARGWRGSRHGREKAVLYSMCTTVTQSAFQQGVARPSTCFFPHVIREGRRALARGMRAYALPIVYIEHLNKVDRICLKYIQWQCVPQCSRECDSAVANCNLIRILHKGWAVSMFLESSHRHLGRVPSSARTGDGSGG